MITYLVYSALHPCRSAKIHSSKHLVLLFIPMDFQIQNYHCPHIHKGIESITHVKVWSNNPLWHIYTNNHNKNTQNIQTTKTCIVKYNWRYEILLRCNIINEVHQISIHSPRELTCLTKDFIFNGLVKGAATISFVHKYSKLIIWCLTMSLA